MTCREAKHRSICKSGFYGPKVTSRCATRVSGQEQCAKAVDIPKVFGVRKLRGEKKLGSLDREM